MIFNLINVSNKSSDLMKYRILKENKMYICSQIQN